MARIDFKQFSDGNCNFFLLNLLDPQPGKFRSLNFGLEALLFFVFVSSCYDFYHIFSSVFLSKCAIFDIDDESADEGNDSEDRFIDCEFFCALKCLERKAVDTGENNIPLQLVSCVYPATAPVMRRLRFRIRRRFSPELPRLFHSCNESWSALRPNVRRRSCENSARKPKKATCRRQFQ
jgi:hypothetical protein